MKKIIYFIVALAIFATSCTTQEEKKSDPEVLTRVESTLYEKVSDTTKIPIVVVRKGMTLWNLAKKVTGNPENWEHIAVSNPDIITDSDYHYSENNQWFVILHPGDTLVIPKYLLKKPIPKEVGFVDKVEEYYNSYWWSLYKPLLNEKRGDSILVAYPYHPIPIKGKDDEEVNSERAAWGWVNTLLNIAVVLILLFLVVAGFTFFSLFWSLRNKKNEGDDDREEGKQQVIDIQKLNVEILLRYLQQTGGEMYIEKNKNGDISIMLSIPEQKPPSK